MEIIRKENSGLLCFLALFCLCNAESASVAPNGVGNEVLTLMDIKNLLVDPRGVLDSWVENTPDPCTWAMVTCSADNLVIGLEAPSQNLSGTLSPAIGSLTHIQSVLLQNNNISGDIPSEIGTLSKLQALDLSNNSFSGQIPSNLSHLKSLQYVMLNNNSLSGEIPDSLANLTQLSLLDLSFNNLSGDVPVLSARVYNIVGNPYICSNGADRKGGCLGKELGLLPSSSKAGLRFRSGIYKSGIFYVILILASKIFS